MIRIQFMIYATREDAIADGWPGAEFGTWQEKPSSPRCIEGWIALDDC